MIPQAETTPQNPAVVARPLVRPSDADQYLMLTAQGAPRWTTDLRAATAFPSMREATRAALRLPSNLRAFGLPLRAEMHDSRLH